MPMPKGKEKPKKIQGHPTWKFNNLDNKETMVWLNQTFRWCTNDCHPYKMWCPRINCMSRAEYRKKMEGTASAGRNNKCKASKNFRVAMSAL
eukprot:5606736-Ditylum_brightwellii.AAC.1